MIAFETNYKSIDSDERINYFNPGSKSYFESNSEIHENNLNTSTNLSTSSNENLQTSQYKRIIYPSIVSFNVNKTFRFKALQKWEGVIDDIDDNKIYTSLIDITNGGEDEAILEMEDVNPDDLELVIPGAIFYWSIGYEIAPHGQRSKKSIIRFRRLPKITPVEFDKIYDKAKELEEADIWE